MPSISNNEVTGVATTKAVAEPEPTVGSSENSSTATPQTLPEMKSTPDPVGPLNLTIDQQPLAQKEMQLTPKMSAQSQPNSQVPLDDNRSLSLVGSGYDRDTNECTDFCLELFSCFGLFDDCCPSDGEGCVSNTGTFFGNVCVGMCKC